MKQITVALLSGGISPERDVSLNGGDQVFEALDKRKYSVVRYDPMYDLARLVKDAGKIDVALIIMHGQYGEDGTIQGLLDLLNIPYQGSGVLGSALAMNKCASKRIYIQAGIPTTPCMIVNKDDTVKSTMFIDRLGLPLVVKPVAGGSSIGMSLVKTKKDLKKACKDAFDCGDSVLVESYIEGVELTGSVIGNDSLEALPIVEIIPDKQYDFFNYEAKYKAGATKEICPARISSTITKKIQKYAKMAHTALFCKGYSRTDFILKDKDIYVLETNTIPGMTPTSLLPLAARTAGISFKKLLDKLIKLSIEENGRG